MMDIPFPKDSWNLSIAGGKLPSLPPVVTLPVTRLSPPEDEDDESSPMSPSPTPGDLQIMKYIDKISKYDQSNHLAIGISDGAKPFVSVLYHMYILCGDIQERSIRVLGKLKSVADDVHALREEIDKKLQASWINWIATSSVFQDWSMIPFLKRFILRVTMQPCLKPLEPLVRRIFEKSEELLKDVDSGLLQKSMTSMNDRMSRQYLHHISLAENAHIRDELEPLRIASFMMLLLVAVLRDVKSLEEVQNEFSKEVNLLKDTLLEIGCVDLFSRLPL